jgi:hypothetical protein
VYADSSPLIRLSCIQLIHLIFLELVKEKHYIPIELLDQEIWQAPQSKCGWCDSPFEIHGFNPDFLFWVGRCPKGSTCMGGKKKPG